MERAGLHHTELSFLAVMTELATLCLTVQSEVSQEIAADKVFVQGVDTDGRPFMYIQATKHVVA